MRTYKIVYFKMENDGKNYSEFTEEVNADKYYISEGIVTFENSIEEEHNGKKYFSDDYPILSIKMKNVIRIELINTGSI